jgi:hypothetical protein
MIRRLKDDLFRAHCQPRIRPKPRFCSKCGLSVTAGDLG